MTRKEKTSGAASGYSKNGVRHCRSHTPLESSHRSMRICVSFGSNIKEARIAYSMLLILDELQFS